MRIIEAKDYKELSKQAANIIAAQIVMKPDCVLGWRPVLHRSAHTISLWRSMRTEIWISQRFLL